MYVASLLPYSLHAFAPYGSNNEDIAVLTDKGVQASYPGVHQLPSRLFVTAQAASHTPMHRAQQRPAEWIRACKQQSLVVV